MANTKRVQDHDTMRVCPVLFALCLALAGEAGPRARAGETVSGTIVSPAGEPIDDASEIIFVSRHKQAWPNVPANQRKENKRGAGSTKTDASGRVSIELPDDVRTLCIHHRLGYAEVKPDAVGESTPVKLEPWCRVEGVVKIGAKTSAAGVEVWLGTLVSAARCRCVTATRLERMRRAATCSTACPGA